MRFSKEIKESLTLKYGQLARELKELGHDIISMTVGEPNFKTPSYVVKSVSKYLNEGYTKYSDSQGILPLRVLISKDLNDSYNTNFTPSNVIITPGVKSGIHLALSAILSEGDEVIIMSPYYLSYPPLIKISEYDAKIVDVPFLNDGTIDQQSLKKAFNAKTKCIIVNSPSNPTGKIFTVDEVNFIINLAKKYNTFILTDEIYDKLIFEGFTFESFLGKGLDDLVIYVNGYSKSYAMTGYRLGYVTATNEIIKKMVILQQNINTNPNTFIQYGVMSIYENEPTHIKPYLKELEYRVNLFNEFLQESKLFSGIKPEAGFYYFVDISKSKLTSEEFTEKLINEAKIVVTPGIAFGENFDNYVRFSLAINDESLIKAIKRLKEFEKNFLL